MLRLYLLEVRNRLGLIIFAWVLTFFICYYYKQTLLFLFAKPLVRVYSEEDVYNYFIATNLTDIFSSYVLISFFIGNQLTLFFAGSQLLIFFSPALYNYEYRRLRNLCLFSSLLWLLNILVLNSFMFSHVFNFFISFQDYTQIPGSVHFEIRVIDYLKFYINLFYFSAFSFQTFLFIFLFLNNLKNKEKFLKKYRKLFFFSFFLIATLISPPDVLSQVFLGFSFMFVFEILIIVTLTLNNLNRIV